MNSGTQIPSPEDLLSHVGWIRTLAGSLTADDARADDLTQETWVAALENRASQHGALRAWLAAILHNLARQDWRSEGARSRREQAVASAEALPSGDELLQRIEQQRMLVDLVTKLAESQRTVVILHYYEGLSAVEIARRLGQKPGTIRQRLKRALSGLREELDGRYGGREAWLSALTPLAKLTPCLPTAATGALLGTALVLKKAIALAAVLVALVGGGVYLSRDVEQDPELAALTHGDQPGAEEGHAGASAIAARPEDVISQPVDQRVPAGEAGAGTSTWTLTGRVERSVLQAGEDPTLEVFVLTQAMAYSRFVADQLSGNEESLVGRTTVQTDGSFEIDLPTGYETAHLMLRGRYLYLEESVESRRTESLKQTVLDAVSGAWVHGELVVPGSMSGSLLGEIPMRLASEVMFEGEGVGASFRYVSASGEGGAFEFRAVPVNASVSLFTQPDAFAALMSDLGETSALEEKDLQLQLFEGGSVEGRVVNAAGELVEGATVRAILRGKVFGFDDDTYRTTLTDGAGAFRLNALPPGELQLAANKNGFLDSEKQSAVIKDRLSQGGLVIALSEGKSLRGVTRFEDGTPAANVEVAAEFDDSFRLGPAAFNRLRGAEGKTTSDEQGRFRIGGLGAGPFVITASTNQGEDKLLTRLDAVKGGTAGLELTLIPPLGLRGMVQTSQGAAVSEFEVYATRISAGSIGDMATGKEEQAFVETEGRFELQGLLPGRWFVVVSAPGLAQSEKQELQLPQTGEDLQFVLEVPVSVTGRVVTEDGMAVAGATVALDTGFSAVQQYMQGGPDSPSCTSGSDGSFHLTGLQPGLVAMHARSDGYAWSEVVSIEVWPGETADGASLVLRKGGVITGEAYDEGEPASGRMVNLIQWGGKNGFDTRMTETDEAGRFRLKNIEPGSWQLLVIDNRRSGGSTDGGSAGHNMFGSMMSQSVEVEYGSEQHVVLGAAPLKPVRVFGQVTLGDRAFGDLGVSFKRLDPERVQEAVLCSVGSDGRYEAVVDGAGSYVITTSRIAGVAGQISALSFHREIPDKAQHEFNIQLPGGGISGRVLDEAGQPIPEARVTLFPDSDASLKQLFAPRFIETLTDSQGRFELDGLAEGTYLVLAGGGGQQASTPTARRSRVAVDGLTVEENRWLRNVRIQLPVPGHLEVSARNSAGQPVPQASLFLRNARGQVLEALAREQTDSKGEALYTGIAPGEYTLLARTGGMVSEEVSVVVQAGEGTKIELKMEIGSWLNVRTLDSAGDLVGTVLTVVDSQGREVGSLFRSVAEASKRLVGSSTGEHQVGPLLTGSYRVSVLTATGAQVEKPARIKHGQDRKLTVRIRKPR